ncbi:hypothetical protein I6I78_01105 [Enterococcus casseliflavus]|uniref:Uncharacterized protein n=1 Tax=Enterococcus casseliflavus TaxID=37734 RepID=A0A415EMA7_ENTCA|nr:hypothetical protein [Enterococcus casseliflavus]QQU19966.1 hypothetical protein I6I78_01105 [Enterococcus casseliflavus]RHK03100.1 hypothetical protein DW084_17585 [Enterococcus casseliflavus]
MDDVNHHKSLSCYYFNFKKIKKSVDREKLEAYCEKHLTEFVQLIESISKDNFWEVFPKILGVDAKMNLVSELSRFDDFSADEIIRITENDYKTYFKEICGHDLSIEKKNSIVFNVS